MVARGVLAVMSFDFVELILFECDPVGNPLVGVTFNLRMVVFTPASGPAANIGLRHSVSILLSFVELSGADQRLAEIVTGKVEAVLSSFRSLKPALGISGSARVVAISVIPGGEELGLNSWSFVVFIGVPAWVFFRICGIKDLLTKSMRAWLITFVRDSGGLSSHASNLV